MKDLFVTSSMNYLIRHGYDSELEIEKYTYGLEGLYSFCTKIGLILIVNIVLGTWLEFLIFHTAYALIRAFAFGTHAKNDFWCWIFTTIQFVSIPLLIKHYTLSCNVILVVSLIASVTISIFSPADTKLRPLIDRKKRIQDKILATIVCTIYVLIIIFLNNSYISNILFYALLLEAIMVNPLTYFIFSQSYNNYRDYKD